MDTCCCKDRTRLVPANQALGTIFEAPSSDSDDPELRHDVYPNGGHGYCTRDEFLARLGPIDGAAWWDRAGDPCADDTSDSFGAASGPGAESDGDAAAANDHLRLHPSRP